MVEDAKNVVVVTATASGKTLCYNLPVLNAVLENADTRALYLFPTKALGQDQLAELQDLAKRLDNSFGVFTFFFSSRRRHTRSTRDWSSDVCSSDLAVFVRNLADPEDRLWTAAIVAAN